MGCHHQAATFLQSSARKHAYYYHRHNNNNRNIKSIVFTTRHNHHLSTNTNTSHQCPPKPRVSWLDLRGTGLSAIERLAIEELLLRHDPMKRCWAIIGMHEPTENRILTNNINNYLSPHNDPTSTTNQHRNYSDNNDALGDYPSSSSGSSTEERNTSCAIILGIGGKAERLIDIESAKKDGVLIIKRFSGGGTVVVDHSSLWTTFIGRNDIMLPHHVVPYPREIMKWSADAIFGPAFDRWNKEILQKRQQQQSSAHDTKIHREKSKRPTLIVHGKSCGLCGGDNESVVLPTDDIQTSIQRTISASSLPIFRLRENDYILDSLLHGERKIGGNAQAIVSGGFLHHTSFLWDWDNINMNYLKLPDKRPPYRGDRSHDDFLVRLKDHYGYSTKNSLFEHMKNAMDERFHLEEVTLRDVVKIANDQFGGLQEWFDGKCRTRVVQL